MIQASQNPAEGCKLAVDRRTESRRRAALSVGVHGGRCIARSAQAISANGHIYLGASEACVRTKASARRFSSTRTRRAAGT